jgi:uncharacterized protein
MTGTEEALTFDCCGERLVGIVSRPVQPADLGVVIIVGGPQYRAGSHRQFVMLARSLCEAGFPVFRFDCRGMGDSEGSQRDFEHIDDDVRAAVDALQRAVPGVERVALWGLCDGASAALLYMHEQRDERVAGLCLVNPWLRSDASLSKTHVKHYYPQRLMQRAFWVKLASGKVGPGATVGLWRNVRTALSGRSRAAGTSREYQQRMARSWAAFRGSVLVLLSESDYTAREFLEYAATDTDWRRAMRRKVAEQVVLPKADHTCTAPESRLAVEGATLSWLTSLATDRGVQEMSREGRP